MVYNPEKSKETTQLPKDKVLDGEIIQIQEGRVRDFVQNLEKWKQPDGEAILVKYKVLDINLEQVFTYKTLDGFTTYGSNSNLGKFKAKYDKLPMHGLKIKVATNEKGYGTIKLD